jgi:serine/threonine protein kinase
MKRFQSELQTLALVHAITSKITKAMSNNHKLSGFIQPEALRAPEVTLGKKWRRPVDIWSFGCVVNSEFNASLIYRYTKLH